MRWLRVVAVFTWMIAIKVEAVDNSAETTTITAEDLTTRLVPHDYFKPCKTKDGIIIKIETENFLKPNQTLTHIESDESTLKCYKFQKSGTKDRFVALNLHQDMLCRYDFFMGNDTIKDYFVPGFALTEAPNCSEQDYINESNYDPECPVDNFSITPIFHETNQYIRLNISWDRTDLNETVTLQVQSKETPERTDCSYSSNETKHNISVSSLIKPPYDYASEPEIKPGCRYDVTLVQNGTNVCKASYLVPDCIGSKLNRICNCHKFTPSPKISYVDHIDGKNFMVEWNPGQLPNKTGSYNIEQITFQYISQKSVSDKFHVYNPLYNNSQITMDLFDGERYTLKGTFYNNFSCSATAEIEFTAPKSRHYYIYIIIGSTLVGLVLTLQTAFTYGKMFAKYLRSKYRQMHGRNVELMPLQPLQSGKIPLTMINPQYAPLTEVTDAYEFPRNLLIIKEFIARGAFGLVYSAKAFGIGGVDGYKMVAVKTLGEEGNVTNEAANDFKLEIDIFKKIGQHPNVVTLLGCCTLEKPYMMIMEFAPCGDLKKYLLGLREQWLLRRNRQVFFPDTSDGAYIEPPNSPVSITSSRLPSTSETVCTTLEDPMTPLLAHYTLERVLDHKELQNFAFQIAKGMAHLEQIPITHRDLAARNILINEYKTLKISDFGLSRTGPYINHKSNKLPLRWTAIEAITERKYDSRSDVWAFGVVLWEIGTLGASPYENILDSALLQFLQLGGRLDRPEICTDALYSLMQQCWASDPNERPTFRELVDTLDVKKQKIYVNFSQLNPTYVFPPSEIEKCVANPVTVVQLDIGKRGQNRQS